MISNELWKISSKQSFIQNVLKTESTNVYLINWTKQNCTRIFMKLKVDHTSDALDEI
jgi:hypothetical protein